MMRASARVAAHGRPLLYAAWGWSAALFVATVVVVVASNPGSTALVVGAVPIMLCGIVTVLLLPQGRIASNTAAVAGIVVTTLVGSAALISFVTPMLAVIPTCALLIAACGLQLS